MKKNLYVLALITLFEVMSACTTVQDNRTGLHSTQGEELTVGIVQREIKKGMSGAEVTEALGSPNVVTKDESDDETWVYDKIATEASYNQNQSGLFLILGGMSSQSGSMAVTQKTLTVVIKFDGSRKVKAFSYHSSKF